MIGDHRSLRRADTATKGRSHHTFSPSVPTGRTAGKPPSCRRCWSRLALGAGSQRFGLRAKLNFEQGQRGQQQWAACRANSRSSAPPTCVRRCTLKRHKDCGHAPNGRRPPTNRQRKDHRHDASIVSLPASPARPSPRSSSRPVLRRPWPRRRNLRQLWVKTPDGLTISAQDWGNPTGPEIVFIHGFSQSHLSWIKQVTRRACEGLPHGDLRLRGHGNSDKPLEPERYKDSGKSGPTNSRR